MVSAGIDKKIILVDLVRRHVVSQASVKSWVKAVDFSPDGSRIASAEFDGSVSVWKSPDLKKIKSESRKFAYPALRTVFSADGKFVIASGYFDAVEKWSLSSKDRVADQWTGHDDFVCAMALSPDGKLCATGDWDGMVFVRRVADGTVVKSFRGARKRLAIFSVAFMPNATTLVTGAQDNAARLWDIATGREIATLTGHKSTVTGLCPSVDVSKLLTTSQDYTIRIWDVATQAALFDIEAHEDWITALAATSDRKRIATGDSTGCIKIWDFSALLGDKSAAQARKPNSKTSD